ncbi:hypothetical protein [Trichlorobacter lovleyi]|uniref:Uncharacterized protein n=1 Tax=Trichlorobacter lovleyi (strain ATCC BAA-1151 / DSM 17278 / SZ) TaxID=398767 RepID=B3E6M0_TRIL1|nr:hypothetical protein [Trichlorobacter lovleyi]ACD94845.1 hypothetical protein Glov_1123 [Trichlorobacter lovleyi SZ]
MIYPNSPEVELRSLINILERETYDFAVEFIDLPRDEQLDRISDLRVLTLTIKQISDEEAGCCQKDSGAAE